MKSRICPARSPICAASFSYSCSSSALQRIRPAQRNPTRRNEFGRRNAIPAYAFRSKKKAPRLNNCMNTSFKEYCRKRRLDEVSQNPLLDSPIQTMQKFAQTNLAIAAIVADRQRFEEFLSLGPQALQGMSPEQRSYMQQSPMVMLRMLQPMFIHMARKYPALVQGQQAQSQQPMQAQNPMQHRQAQNPQQQPLSLAAQLATQLGQPPEVYVNALKSVMANNPQRVAVWASQIRTPQDLLAKFNDWKQRGIL